MTKKVNVHSVLLIRTVLRARVSVSTALWVQDLQQELVGLRTVLVCNWEVLFTQLITQL